MKQNSNHINDDLLVKHLLGEASATESLEVSAWLRESEENQQYYNHLQTIWEQSRNLAASSTVDTEAAWARFQQKILAEEAAPAQSRTIPLRPRRWLSAAAALIVLAGTAWMVYYLTGAGTGNMITLKSGDVTLTDTLSDGSVVTLNKNTTFTYPRYFAGNTRAVKLDGEAFFNISPDKTKPFIITANGVDVKVVGTSFNVKSSDEKTEVIVETGLVEVKKKKDAILLHPREQATVLKADAAPVKKTADDVLYNYYRTKEFICNGTPLWRLADVLSEAYNTEIVIEDNHLKSMLLTATFRDEPLENILSVISETFNINVEKEGRKFILKPR